MIYTRVLDSLGHSFATWGPLAQVAQINDKRIMAGTGAGAVPLAGSAPES